VTNLTSGSLHYR